MKRSEQILQIAVFKVLTPLMYLQKYSQFMAFQIRNETGVGGAKGAMIGAFAKAMGTMEGVADTVFLFPRKRFVACGINSYENDDGIAVFVEYKAMKPLKTRDRLPEELLEDPQIRFRDRVNNLGFEYRIIAATDENDAVNQTLALLKEHGVRV